MGGVNQADISIDGNNFEEKSFRHKNLMVFLEDKNLEVIVTKGVADFMKPYLGLRGGSCLDQGLDFEMTVENEFPSCCQIDGEIVPIKEGKSRILLKFSTQVHLLKYQ